MRIAIVVAIALTLTGADARRRILVSDAVANGVDPALAKTLTSMLVARLDAQKGFHALSGTELKRLMSLEAEKAACGSDQSCLAEITDAIGAPLAVFADVGKLGALTVVNLTLFDVEKAEPIARASVESEKLEDLPKKLDVAAAELLAQAAPGSKEGVARAPASAAPPPPSVQPPSAPPPGEALGATDKKGKGRVISGEMDRDELVAVLHSHKDEMTACYDAARKKDPNLSGKVTVRFLIASDGTVTWASIQKTDIVKSTLPGCLIGKVGAWKFKATGSPTTIAYPFSFHP